MEKFRNLVWAKNWPKTPKSGFSRSWDPLWAKRPPNQFDRMPNADPMNPAWGPTCPWEPRYGRFAGGLGAVSSVGDRFRWLGTQPTKNRFATRHHRPVFGIFLAQRNRVCVAQLSCCDEVACFHTSFSRNSRFPGFRRGLGDLEKFRDPVWGPERVKNAQKWIFPVSGAVLGETPSEQI